MEKLHEKIKLLRENAGISQCRLAKELEVNQANISRWESGQQLPDINGLHKLAVYFDVSADYLLGLES